MSKHTPGPWVVIAEDERYPGIEARNVTPRESIVVFGEAFEEAGVRGNSHEESIANAHLIAAAPELLEAVEFIVGALEDGPLGEHKSPSARVNRQSPR